MFLPRKIYQDIKDHLRQKQVTVITGMRRSGKTFIVEQLLLDIESSNKMYIDLQKADLREIFKEKNYDNILLDLAKRFGLDPKEKMYVVIDEIQTGAGIAGRDQIPL